MQSDNKGSMELDKILSGVNLCVQLV